MKLYYDNDGVYEELTQATTVNVFKSLNGYVGSEKTTKFKIVAEVGETLSNLYCRLFTYEQVNGSQVQNFLIPFNSDKSKLVVQNNFNIKYEFENIPDKKGIVFLTSVLNNEESEENPGTFPYREFEFYVTIFVSEKTITEILTENSTSVNIEIIYN